VSQQLYLEDLSIGDVFGSDSHHVSHAGILQTVRKLGRMDSGAEAGRVGSRYGAHLRS
jgi:hypothetical protein